jgi:Ca-activated chloride channel family protein
MMRTITRTLLLACLALCVPRVARADLPSFLRKQNGDVTDGNALLAKGDAKGALAAYDRAARALPDAPGVHLDRGLALLKLGEFSKAKEALLSATGPAAPTDIRADAYANLALSYYREADALAGQKKHEDAQKLFRDSVDAAKRSLRLRPGEASTAWNLELAARRMREEEKEQKKDEDKKKQDEDKKDQDKKDEGKQDQKPSDGDSKDDQAKNDAPKPDDKPGEKPGDKDQKPKPSDPPKDGKDPASSQAQKAAADQKDKNAGDKPLPSDVAHALDALQDGEENFERVRARQRAQQERRAPEKDW